MTYTSTVYFEDGSIRNFEKLSKPPEVQGEVFFFQYEQGGSCILPIEGTARVETVPDEAWVAEEKVAEGMAQATIKRLTQLGGLRNREITSLRERLSRSQADAARLVSKAVDTQRKVDALREQLEAELEHSHRTRVHAEKLGKQVTALEAERDEMLNSDRPLWNAIIRANAILKTGRDPGENPRASWPGYVTFLETCRKVWRELVELRRLKEPDSLHNGLGPAE